MIKTNEFTLANGLRVVHNFDDTTLMVALDVLYNVGARDESPDLTGIAHLFEHLMFSGSENVADFDHELELAGGWSNAWTTNDFTNFYDVVPAVNAETAFWLESDRMKSLSFDPHALEVQRQVVVEEFKQVCLNKPYGDLGHHLRRLVYTTHPYRYPTIGKEPGHIERVTMDDVKQFFYRHYSPNNAVLGVSGNISLERTRELAEKWFGSIESRPVAPRLYLPEPPVTSARRVTVSGRVPQPVIVIAFPMDAYNHPDYIVADLITDVLSNGRSARFFRNLVTATDLFVEADASILGSEEPGYMMITGKLRRSDPGSVAEAERLIWEQLDAITDCQVEPHELARALNRFESNHTFGCVNYLAKAQSVAMCAMHGEDINATVPRYRCVTVDDLQRVARRIVRRDASCTLIYLPENQNQDEENEQGN